MPPPVGLRPGEMVARLAAPWPPTLVRNRRLGDHVPRGWLPLHCRFVLRLRHADPDAGVEFTREKFAKLRIFLEDAANDDAHALVDEAGRESQHVCEVFGAPGRANRSSWWWRARCDVRWNVRDAW